MLTWQTCSKETIPLELEVMNSNPTYNILSENKPFLIDLDIIAEHEEKIKKERFIITDSLKTVAIIDFTMCNPRDQNPWLGLLIVHYNHQKQGFASQIYIQYEQLMKERHASSIHLGCLKANDVGLQFWNKHGYIIYEERNFRGKELLCLKKEL
jgi:GNAT superfamily N-acetyltransferase